MLERLTTSRKVMAGVLAVRPLGLLAPAEARRI